MADKLVRVENGVKVRVEKNGQFYWDFEHTLKGRKTKPKKSK